MNKAFILASALSVSASAAFAGGPVIIHDDAPVVVVEEKPRSGSFLPLLLGVVIIGAVVAGNGS
ncbi:hypothetical protein Q9295_02035 [Xinfangfangia sp. CPCC 101601]|uniref:Ferrochelatase n=1 Tax=Pseudogemmobacter lacusdianii TaxID=3069608 RepID=A0ABU0VTU6_9RHOB|nr:hypothetical protein [Xinfangfangia sp. CPCC 101601]MDQ2065139.1 hypothetical protein [Xinfangfangia sp. CPCC 101601]